MKLYFLDRALLMALIDKQIAELEFQSCIGREDDAYREDVKETISRFHRIKEALNEED